MELTQPWSLTHPVLIGHMVRPTLNLPSCQRSVSLIPYSELQNWNSQALVVNIIMVVMGDIHL